MDELSQGLVHRLVESNKIVFMLLATLAVESLETIDVQSFVKSVDEDRLFKTVDKLSSFHTRNSLSPGHKEACDWLAGEFAKIPGVKVEVTPYTMPAGRRVPKETAGFQVVATITGATDRVILMGGHIDSLNLDGDPLTVRAPGANDDASGVAATLEAARVLSGNKWACTLKFVAFSGEEQGLLGSTALAQLAKDEGWKLEAVLSNDTVGSSKNLAGQKDKSRVRVFSEETAGNESRELARFVEWKVGNTLKNFKIKLVFRRDRFGRGGDHTPFVAQGFPAIRFVEVHEEYTRQHTVDDVIKHMDFGYLANVTRANVAVIASLAASSQPPMDVKVKRDQSHDTTLTWKGDPKGAYQVYWRETTSPVWQKCMDVGSAVSKTVPGVNKDDHVFAVAAQGGVPRVAE